MNELSAPVKVKGSSIKQGDAMVATRRSPFLEGVQRPLSNMGQLLTKTRA
jgi:hypothetical protein